MKLRLTVACELDCARLADLSAKPSLIDDRCNVASATNKAPPGGGH